MTSGDTGTPQERLREELALLAVYLLSSGRGLLDEPPDYGAFRCTDAARRVLHILEADGPLGPEMAAVRGRLDDFMFAPMGGDDVDLAGLLDEACLQMAVALQGTEKPA
ncbi:MULTISPECIES: DUF6092 family protein [unclassified Streptomyces]|uniref:DUF6092 family protein n=1 Tax=unclassified Streptomyces TaxID=2593676 RepID=UPI000C276BC4|nr:DUF6092 family protein [Streptomyces sp. CB02959]PJN39580.1 hypothetical protein CG747_16670 [Streptomyces sp. CB02959]